MLGSHFVCSFSAYHKNSFERYLVELKKEKDCING
jgi:hypothetical protein